MLTPKNHKSGWECRKWERSLPHHQSSRPRRAHQAAPLSQHTQTQLVPYDNKLLHIPALLSNRFLTHPSLARTFILQPPRALIRQQYRIFCLPFLVHCQSLDIMAIVNPLLNVKDSRWLQLEVCREYQRNKCTRPDSECKFAHPAANVEVQNGRVIACYDSIKVFLTFFTHFLLPFLL